MISSHCPLAWNPNPQGIKFREGQNWGSDPNQATPSSCMQPCRHRIGQQCYAREHGSQPAWVLPCAWNPWWEQYAQACLYSILFHGPFHTPCPVPWHLAGSPTSEALNHLLTGHCSEKHMLCAHLSGQELQKALRLRNSSQRELLHISDYFFILVFFFLLFQGVPANSSRIGYRSQLCPKKKKIYEFKIISIASKQGSFQCRV